MHKLRDHLWVHKPSQMGARLTQADPLENHFPHSEANANQIIQRNAPSDHVAAWRPIVKRLACNLVEVLYLLGLDQRDFTVRSMFVLVRKSAGAEVVAITADAATRLQARLWHSLHRGGSTASNEYGNNLSHVVLPLLNDRALRHAQHESPIAHRPTRARARLPR